MSSKAERGYDALAPHYQAIEYLRFGRRLQRARVGLLDALPRPRTALLLGDGDGRLLQAFVSRFPEAKVVSVDLSRKMLGLQRRRLGVVPGVRREFVHWVHGDARQLLFWESDFDVVVAPFFLDVFLPKDIRQLLQRFSTWLAPDGHLYVVDFRQPQTGARYYWAKFWLGMMHLFFRWRTGLEPKQLADLQEMIQQSDFQLVAKKTAGHELIFTAIYRFRR